MLSEDKVPLKAALFRNRSIPAQPALPVPQPVPEQKK